MVVRREGFWSEQRWERLAPLSGVLAIVLFVVGFLVIALAGDPPGGDESAEQYLTYFREDDGSIWAGSWLVALGLVSFIWFLGSLRSVLSRAEGGAGRLTSVAFAGGVAAAILLFGTLGMQLSGAIAADESDNLSAQTAEALWWAGDGFFVGATFTLAVLLGATAIVALRSRLLPPWFGWVTGVMALLALIPFVSWAVIIFAMPLWIIGVSLWMWRWYEPVPGVQVPPPSAPAP